MNNFFIQALRCTGCSALVTGIANPIAQTPHTDCPFGGVLMPCAVMVTGEQASYYTNPAVSTGQRRITDAAAETPSNVRNDHTESDCRPNQNGQHRGQSHGRDRGRGRGGYAAAVTAQGSLIGTGAELSRLGSQSGRGSSNRRSLSDRVTRPQRERSQSPTPRNATSYRNRSPRSGANDPKDQGWLPDGKAYIYDGQRYYPDSWHKAKLQLLRFNKAEEDFDSWKTYKKEGRAFPSALDMPHIMAPHPRYGPKHLDKVRRKESQAAQPQNTPISEKDGSKGGKIKSKEVLKKVSTGPKSLDGIYCLLCRSRLHSLTECTATIQVNPQIFPHFSEQLPVDMVKFQRESKDIAPVGLTSLLEHLFTVRSTLLNAHEWCAGRNASQLTIWKEFKKVEDVESSGDSSKSQKMMSRIIQVDIIYDDLFSGVNNVIRAFNLAWLTKCKDDDLVIVTPLEVGVHIESHEQMVTRFYTTAQPNEWPFFGLEEAAIRMRDEVHKLLEESCEAISSWNRNILGHVKDLSLLEDVSKIDAAEHASYSALTDERAHPKVDPSAWLNFLLIPDTPDEAFERLPLKREFHAKSERLKLTPEIEGHLNHEEDKVVRMSGTQQFDDGVGPSEMQGHSTA